MGLFLIELSLQFSHTTILLQRGTLLIVYISSSGYEPRKHKKQCTFRLMY